MTTHIASHPARDQRQGGASDPEAYWRAIFSGEWPIPRLTFGPAPDSVETSAQTGAADRVELALDAESFAAAAALAAARALPLDTVILAAWYALVQLQTAQDDLVVGVRGPDRRTVPVRLTVDPDAAFADHLEQVRGALDSARRQQDYPFIELARAAGIAAPGDGLCSLIFAADDAAELNALEPGADLLIAVAERQIRISYNPRLFHADAIGRYGRQFAALLGQAGRAPQQPIRTLDAVPDDERARILTEFNNTRSDYPRHKRIEQLFVEQAIRAPDRIAVVHHAATLTYGQLDAYADQLAAVLRRAVQPGEPIALLMPREPAMVVATLAALKAGGVYLPIDPSYPAERIAYMLSDSGARLLLSAEATIGLAQALADAGLFAGRTIALDRSGLVDSTALADRLDQAERPAEPSADPAGQAAYLMYTSGTTGRPKGVLITHRGVARHVCGVEYVQLDGETKMLQAGAIGFDMATSELWGALLNGGCLHIVDRETLLDAAELGRFLAAHETNTAVLPTSLFAQLAEEDPGLFRPLRQLVVGGDALLPRHARRVRQACPELRLINAYGPTENAAVSTAHLVTDRDAELIPIGRPVANSTAYIFSRDGQLQPIGMPGELYVGGDGLALGYLNRPELTAERFVPNPFLKDEGRGMKAEDSSFILHASSFILYKTGDRGRWLPDGSIEFLGRADDQVKLHGYRVELGEIESRVLEQPGVREAIVLAKRRPNGIDSYLCAYVSGDDQLSLPELRASLAAALPAYMLPAAFVRLPVLPLTANGKIDRAALPEPVFERAAETDQQRTAPRDEIERTIARIWEAAFGVAELDVDVSLHTLGASSLTVTLLAAQIERALGVRCPVARIFAAPTIAGIAGYVRQALADGSIAGPALEPAPAKPLYRVSPQQRRLFVEQIKDPASTQYNLPIVIDAPVELDADRLRAALRELARRHEILRTVFVQVDGEMYQRVLPEVAIELPTLERPLDDPAAIAAFVRPFDLGAAPPWRAALARGDGRTRIILDMHHILTDGFSLALLFKEWAALYQGRALAAPGLHYKDYAEWIARPDRAALLAAQERFWLDVFSPPPAPLALPTDLPRQAVRASDGDQIVFELGPERTAALRELARREQATLFHVLLATYGIFLARISGQQDVTVGTPVSGRNIAGTEQIQGMFVNTICMRLRPEPGLSFQDYLRNVAAHALAAADHQEYPFDALVRSVVRERDYSRNPLFDTLFALQNTEVERIDFLGGAPQWMPEATGQTIFDLNVQVHDLPTALTATWGYNRQLFLPPTVESFRAIWLSVIDAALDHPQLTLEQLLVEQRSESVALPDIDFMF
jgi:amino acid adenylation domain-containing protein